MPVDANPAFSANGPPTALLGGQTRWVASGNEAAYRVLNGESERIDYTYNLALKSIAAGKSSTSPSLPAPQRLIQVHRASF